MKQSTKTLLWVLGGVGLVGGAGAAIYFATKKTDTAVLPKGSSPNGATPGSKTGSSSSAPSYQASINMPSDLGTFAQWLAQNSKRLDANGNAVDQ